MCVLVSVLSAPNHGGYIVTAGLSDEDSWVKVEQVLAEWKSLWQACVDDKIRVEEMADRRGKKINRYVFSGLRLKRLTVR
jgi:hypothetical protein